MNEHDEHCRAIANVIEKIVRGELYISKEGEFVEESEELEQASLYDYFSEFYDIEYVVDCNLNYRSCRIMIACGGPNIYISTYDKRVELFWWTSSGYANLSYEACEAIDEYAEELYLLARS